MSEPTDQIRRTLTTAERKQLLVLACSADRAAWVHACRPLPQSPTTAIVNEIIHYIEPFSHLLPGKLGRWVRGATFITSLGRHFGLIGR